MSAINHFDQLVLLENHLLQKAANRNWLFACINGSACHFPYVVKGKGAVVKQEIIEPYNQLKKMPEVPGNNLPLYLVNVPVAHRIEDEEYELIKRLLNLYKSESFGKTKSESLNEIKQRFALVIGVNQIKSLDPEDNKLFRNWVNNIPKIKGIAYRIFGFFWSPSWEKVTETSELIYPPFKAFFILKLLSEKVAKKVKTTLQSNKGKLVPAIVDQIPFQKIREKIKTSDYTTNLALNFAKAAPSSPLYFGVMDADTLHLKQTVGLFTRFDKTIKKHATPSAITHGYRVEEPNRPLIELGVRLDMVCREAMNSVIGYGAYFPEPCSIFCVKEANGTLRLSDMTFIAEGINLENRRFIQNGLRAKVLKQSAVFVADGGVCTTTPSRMKTKKNGEVTSLNSINLKYKKNLQALRAISQSHIHPKQWADNLYIALNFKVSQTTDATAPMMHLFSVYDPLSRIFSSPRRFSAAVVDSVFKNYFQILSNEEEQIREKAKQDLFALGMPMTLVNRIEKAAKASGKAIFELLAKELSIQI